MVCSLTNSRRRFRFLSLGLSIALLWSSVVWAGGGGWRRSGTYTVNFPQSRSTFDVRLLADGGAVVSELGVPGREVKIKPQTLDSLRIRVASNGPGNGDYSVVHAVLPGPFGDPSTITVIGHLDEASMVFSGLMINEESATTDFEVQVSENRAFEEKAIVVIILSAAAVGALACLAGNYLVDCGERCSDSCGEHGVESWTEVCGSCRCECR